LWCRLFDTGEANLGSRFLGDDACDLLQAAHFFSPHGSVHDSPAVERRWKDQETLSREPPTVLAGLLLGRALCAGESALLAAIIRACQRRDFDASEKALLAMLSICFLERLRNLAPTHGFAVPPAGLTRREIDCLKLVARGATDREIGRKLDISHSTAHEHCESAKKKLKVSSRAEAIAIAVSLAVVAP
jgi:DNA-binding CsgD family transcriptional regulator